MLACPTDISTDDNVRGCIVLFYLQPLVPLTFHLSPCDPQSWLYQAVALQITYANLRQNQLIYFQNIV